MVGPLEVGGIIGRLWRLEVWGLWWEIFRSLEVSP